MSNRMEWRFRAMGDGEINVDPIEGEFFTIGALDSLADGLVREAIQNSLDARIPGERVRVRFHFSGPQIALSREERAPFLAGLRPHLESRNCGLPGEVTGADASFKLTRLAGGFRVALARGAPAVPDEVHVRAAYEVRRGNPFSRYSEYDFTLDDEPISVVTRNAEIIERKANTLRVRPGGRSFNVTVKGFDVRRDLRVRVEAGQPSVPESAS